MTIESPPLWLQGGAYPAKLDRQALGEMREEGVANALACKVTQRGAGANFTVDIAVGASWIDGDDEADQGTYQARVTAVENASVTGAPSGSNQRYDIVCLKVNDPNAGGDTGDSVTVEIVEGTESTTPVVPTLPDSCLPLAVIGPITSATASITNALIHDVWTGTGPAFAASCRLLAGDRVPVGELRLRAANPDKVNGWAHCDGDEVSRSTYAALFAEIGTSYGVGDGSTTFNLPDFRDRVPVAKGTSFASVGASGGEINHTLTAAEMPTHSHGGATSGASVGHTHGFSATTGTESAAHSHALSGYTADDGFHVHGDANGQAFVGTAAALTGSAYLQTIGNPATDLNIKFPSVTAGSGQHSHALSGNTGGESVNHTHGLSGTTTGVSADHTHAITSAGSGSAHNNMPPYQVAGGWMIKLT